MSAHTTNQIASVVTVLPADQPVALAVALAVVSDALERPVASFTAVADLTARAASIVTAHTAGQIVSPWV